ncbi:AI-2E family transporter [Haloplasma contractile]|uniref:Membrane protein putative n=1 Tax=Haloplasma contractile SSD-17B TaxID=1033810 RepID=U2EE13_9MOLU|nr:AI-2E family transporter [Haloplasma contractile]ERJ13233.1 Membrane protein putative [Haloplasma contractile SSD-17B]
MLSIRFKRFLEISAIIFVICSLIIIMNYTLPIVITTINFILSLFAPFIAAFFIAFLLSNLIDRLEATGIKRIFAVFIVFIAFISLLVFSIMSLIPLITEQLTSFIEDVPGRFGKLDELLTDLWTRFDFIPIEYRYTLHDVGNFIANFFKNNLKLNVSGIFNIFNIIVLVPIITFYFLLEFNKIKERIRKYLRKKKWFYFHRYLHQLDKGMGSYLKGLLLVILSLSLIASLLFYSVGLKYAILFGVIIGFTNIIPFIGPFIGGAPAVLYGLTQSPETAVFVLIIILALQAIESMVLTPFIQSKSISVHPLYILLALFVFGKVLGLFGMIIAIPLLYFIIVTTHYLRVYYRCKRIKKQQANKTP